ncbi:hypothetical protein GCM10011519_32440 [Marmoricola endophyticus]|uniref:VOC domain-containing protein n=1 Tax=Marmoricola endophyticus TaxID=2040280 RepID=A0A917F885_9ACTN|nr:hypothetical protein GCM10011519_32440 [Marmoricola endophyticus]
MTSTDPALDPSLFVCIDHVGVAVADLDAAIETYASAFGMRVAHRETNEDQGVEEAMVVIGEGEGDVLGQRIQLLAPLSESSTIAKFLDRNGPGLQQLAYRVVDVEATAAILRERGLRLLYDAPPSRHRRQPGQLHPPQGRRRRPRGAGRARGRSPLSPL